MVMMKTTDRIEIESTNCPLCDSHASNSIYGGRRFAPYGIRRCSRCGVAYLSPRLSERAMLAVYQQEQYFSATDERGYSSYSAQESALRATFRRMLKTLAECERTGGALLEIGCGFGYLLDEARPYFTRRVGTDFSAGAVRQAQGRADQIYQGGVEAIAGTENFNCIISLQVIEHVYNPKWFVQALLKRLKVGGCLLIATPDMASYWRILMGSRWPSFKLPEHVVYFDAFTLARLLRECGLREVEPVPCPHAFPLPLIASKFGLSLPASLNRYSLWLPGTTVAVMGVKDA